MITDFVEAFWQIPLAPQERKYFVIKYRGAYLVFLRTAQGSRGAPLSWAAIASLIGRTTQSLYITNAGHEGRFTIYVDDPLLAMRGSKTRRRVLALRFIACCIVLGLNLAFPKAQLGTEVLWIGVVLKIDQDIIIAAIPTDKLEALADIIEKMLSMNLIPLKDVRSLAGKGSNIATLIFAWRPFLSQLWAAMSTVQTNAPPNTVWTRQIEDSLTWMLAFIRQQRGTTQRVFKFNDTFGIAIDLVVTCDASIYGYGAWLSINGKPASWFSDTIQESDEEVLGHKFGENTGQQCFESMCLLLACRTWSHLWRDKRYCFKLKMRSDNTGALAMVSRVKGSSPGMNAIAREFALDAAENSFEPNAVAHLPGITNTVADVLSRRLDPEHKKNWCVPEYLKHVERVIPSPRTDGWWRARKAPSVANSQVGGGA